MRKLFSQTIGRSIPIRVSMAALIRLVKNNQLLLLQSKTTGSFNPFGGVYQCMPGAMEELLQIGFKPERKPDIITGNIDLRGYIKGKDFKEFLNWFNNTKNLEENALARELNEEIKEAGLDSPYPVPAKFQFINKVETGFSIAPGKLFLQYRLFNIYNFHPDDVAAGNITDFLFDNLPLNNKLDSILIGSKNLNTLKGNKAGHHVKYLIDK